LIKLINSSKKIMFAGRRPAEIEACLPFFFPSFLALRDLLRSICCSHLVARCHHRSAVPHHQAPQQTAAASSQHGALFQSTQTAGSIL
jgi:hypothetical protein